MKNMLYYPGFEVQDRTWLKFALLYFDKLRPIIPYTIVSESEYLSNEFRRVMNETDLISPYRPEYEEGNYASILACEEFEKYFSHPERYGAFFGKPYAAGLIEKWKSPTCQDCTLFEGKYSYIFFDFCLQNGIATPCKDGIHISNDLAFVYMSMLANIISRNNELEMITDSKHYSSLILKADVESSGKLSKNIRIAENNIELAIPTNLRDIPMEEIIRLRRQMEFNGLRKAYMNEIDKLIIARESMDENYSLNALLSYKRDFIKICEESFFMIAAATVSVYSFASLANGIQGAELISAIATAAVDYKAAKDTFIELPAFRESLKTKHLARKYLAKIGKLNSAYRQYGG